MLTEAVTRFDRFMEAALYHPECGYYSSRIKSVGTHGDFTTSAQISNTLARAISKTFCDSGCRHLIEVGPGTGQLANDVRQALPFLTSLKTQQHLVEVSAPLRELQQKNNPKAHHHVKIESALEAAAGHAFIYSNELVDAFPARIFRREEAGWSELHLSGSQPQIEENFPICEALPNSCLFDIEHPLHQRIEVHESYSKWLQNWVSHWKSGQFLTIDYTVPTPRPVNGTLRGYFLQERLTGPELYQKAGHIDLTADVHFDDLEHWGSQLGLETISRQTQRQFLQPFANNSSSDHFLRDSQGAGSAFEVLLQRVTPK